MENYQQKYKELKKKYEYSQGYLRLLYDIMTRLYRWDPTQAKRVELIFSYLENAMEKKTVKRKRGK